MIKKQWMFFLIAFACFVVSSCDNHDNELEQNPNQEKTVISASMANIKERTRIAFDDQGEGGVKQTWETNDKFDIYDSKGKYAATFVLATGGENQTTAEFETSTAGLVNGETYTAVYPSIENTPTLEHRARIINGKTQTGNSSLTHIDGQCYMKGTYTHGVVGTHVVFGMEHVMLTVKMEMPEDYNVTTHGVPVNLTFFNGSHSTSLTLTLEGSFDWQTQTLTAYMLIDPIEDVSRMLRFDLLCANDYLFQKEVTSEVKYEIGRRYVGNLSAADKLALRNSYTIDELDRIPETENTWVITNVMEEWEEWQTLRDKLASLMKGDRKIHLVMPNVMQVMDNAFYLDNNYFAEVTTYGAAVKGLSSLISVNFPKAQIIGKSAFRVCIDLRSVSLPAAVEVRELAFNSVLSLSSISLPMAERIDSHAFKSCESLTSTSFPAVTKIGDFAFHNCPALTSLSFPAAVTIEEFAFYYCTSLTSISLPAVTTLHSNAFTDCFFLTSLTLPSVTHIGSQPFYYCTSLESLSLPVVTSIGDRAFIACPALKNLEIATETTDAPTVGTNLFVFEEREGYITQTASISLKVGKAEKNNVVDKTWRGFGSFKSVAVVNP